MTGRSVRLALAAALGAALLAWLTRGVAWTHVAAAARAAPWWAWPLAVSGLLTSYALRALRIRAELRTRHAAPFHACLTVMLVHNAAVNVLPMRGGEAAYPWLVHRRLGVPVAHAVASLVWFRVQDAVVLGIAGFVLWPGLPPAVRAGGAVAIAAGTFVALAALERAARGGVPERRRTLVPRSARAALQALALAPRHGPAGWAFCAGSWTAKLASLGLLLAAVGGLSGADGVTGALGGELAGVLPLQGPAGFGTYEGGVWAGAALRGRSAADVAVPAIAVHLLSLATAVLSGAVAHALARGRPALEPAAEVRP